MHTCFCGLSRAELAHVRRCQAIAQAEGLSVVSSGVLAAPAAGAPAGAHFWLVGSPSSGAVSFVWLSAGGRRLFCGCPRRRGPSGALTCAHAQTVRLWLLAAAGVRVPVVASVPPVPPAPVPPSGGAALPVPVAPVAPSVRVVSGVRRVVSSSPCYDLAPPVVAPRWRGRWARGVVWASLVEPEARPVRLSVRLRPVSSRLRLGRRLRLGLRLSRRCPAALRGALVGASAPAPVASVVAQGSPLGVCPACERPAPRDVLAAFGVCAECLDLMALAESAPSPARCIRHPWSLAVGESDRGPLCAECVHVDFLDTAKWIMEPAGAADVLANVAEHLETATC